MRRVREALLDMHFVTADLSVKGITNAFRDTLLNMLELLSRLRFHSVRMCFLRS